MRKLVPIMFIFPFLLLSACDESYNLPRGTVELLNDWKIETRTDGTRFLVGDVRNTTNKSIESWSVRYVYEDEQGRGTAVRWTNHGHLGAGEIGRFEVRIPEDVNSASPNRADACCQPKTPFWLGFLVTASLFLIIPVSSLITAVVVLNIPYQLIRNRIKRDGEFSWRWIRLWTPIAISIAITLFVIAQLATRT